MMRAADTWDTKHQGPYAQRSTPRCPDKIQRLDPFHAISNGIRVRTVSARIADR
eukprot:COSAG02_NODE_7776_length_2850_cov_5.906409_1_plen_53_part_10